jgi:hypothetical protein
MGKKRNNFKNYSEAALETPRVNACDAAKTGSTEREDNPPQRTSFMYSLTVTKR